VFLHFPGAAVGCCASPRQALVPALPVPSSPEEQPAMGTDDTLLPMDELISSAIS